MNNANIQWLFQFLILLSIHVIGEIDPYLEIYDFKTLLTTMNMFEINNVPNWKNNIFLNYINIKHKEDINITMNNKLFFYNLKTYTDFKYLLPSTNKLTNQIHFMLKFGICSHLYKFIQI